MISNIGNSVYNNNLEFAKKATKYLQGEKVTEQGAAKEIVSSLPTSAAFASVFTVIPAAKSLIKNRKIASNIKENLTIAAGTVKDEIVLNKLKEAAEKKATKKGVGFLGKLFKKTAEDNIKSAGEKAVANATKNIVKKGLFAEAKSFALFNLVFEIPNVVKAFKDGGFKEGVKQIGRSGVNAAADAIGYAAGMKLGATIGTACGGPVGTIIGGALGMVLGGVATTLIGKATEKIIGKNYSEQVKEQEQDALAEQIANDSAMLNELKSQVEEKISQTEAAGGKIDKNTLEMKEALEHISTTTSPNVTNAFTGSNADKKINDSVRLNSKQTTNNQIENTNTTNPISQAVQTANVWSPKTVGEMTSGLFDSNGQIKIHSLDKIA